ncbi:MAG TPA: hypothetical protein ENI32_02905 [Candidatus Syntrophoarchaeum butanivorans]|uniref:Uncharacterized protein n=1 Tax=Candidatus Syntropharchaeum butanivorans TaxID=1839936 RepID=A0A1F2P305_9EURY|nr:MAG: hypothetical protein SBU_001447 [Candidatus Syntrophoarchaeum butanivorans]HEC56821.1 hypothetical protein [Candidatus Syntrophoarchaeum butanivorans]
MPIEERFIVEQKLTVDTPIPDVTPGDDLVVTGTSSRKDETVVMVTVKGPVVGPAPVIAIVANGTWTATFDTSGAEVGVYTVKADDGDKTATATVNLISPAPTPTETPPGFQAIFAIMRRMRLIRGIASPLPLRPTCGRTTLFERRFQPKAGYFRFLIGIALSKMGFCVKAFRKPAVKMIFILRVRKEKQV